MHRAGANGKGRLVNEDADTIAADLETSAQILGAKEVVAYPFGHYDDTTKEGVRRAGFALGRGSNGGTSGSERISWPCPSSRIDYGMTVDDLRPRSADSPPTPRTPVPQRGRRWGAESLAHRYVRHNPL